MMTVLPSGPVSMGRPLLRWFFCLLIVAGFVAVNRVRVGARRHRVPAGRQRRSWVLTAQACVGAMIYAGLNAGTLGGLWPHYHAAHRARLRLGHTGIVLCPRALRARRTNTAKT